MRKGEREREREKPAGFFCLTKVKLTCLKVHTLKRVKSERERERERRGGGGMPLSE